MFVYLERARAKKIQWVGAHIHFFIKMDNQQGPTV